VPVRGGSTGGSDDPGTGDDPEAGRFDTDGDGFSPNQGDCNDADPSVYPGASEICGDSIDQDCDGSDKVCPVDPNDVDNDGDGYTENQFDFDDNDPLIYPGAPEICGDGIDQDCDGLDKACVPDNMPPDQPLALSPNANIIASLTPELMTYEFVDLDDDAHVKTRWLIGESQTDESFMVIDEITETQLTSWQVPSDCILEKDTQYYWRAMFFDGQDWSASSNINSFRTGSAGIEFDENGIGKESVIDPGEPVQLGKAFMDADGNLITSDTIKAFKSLTNPDVQIGMIVEDGCNIEKICSRRPEDIVSENSSFDGEIPEMPYGMIDFALTVPEKGAVADVTIYFSEPLPEDFRWWKYDPKIGFYDYAASAYPVPVLSVSSDRKSVALQLKDGGYGDLIEEPDGKIFDPSGAGLSIDSTSPSSSGGGGGSCFIRSLMF
jgi:hypothetical protein